MVIILSPAHFAYNSIMSNKKRKIHIRERLAKTLDLPIDSLCDMTRITLLGDSELLIERFRGLYLYSENEIILTIDGKRLTVTGADLVITGAFSDRMMIVGKIESIAYSDY